ncbi:hypothetical protein MYX07_03340 [Patescibacteria group bacterium AH-259-L07]|nr:hypothetical protein [Patescibacteria group bacterium AH-259-L07]
MKSKKDYLKYRNKYKPDEIRVIFVLESPPISGNYFYNNEGEIAEPLFKAMMKLIDFVSEDKETGLQEFKKRGLFLVDAIYTPINYPEKGQRWRNDQILERYPILVKDLKNLVGNNSIPLILAKINICRLLEKKLKKDGFRVLNNGVEIPFPAHGWQNTFTERAAEVFRRTKFTI